MRETELGAVLVQWLEEREWDVYQEVPVHRSGGRVADIVAVKGPLSWIIELKVSLTFGVVEQAARWRCATMRSIAVPPTRGRNHARRFAEHACRYKWNIGVLHVSPSSGRVNVAFAAPLLRECYRTAKSQLIPSLHPLHKTSARAGAASASRHDTVMTPFRLTMRSVRRYLEANPGATMKEIVEGVGGHHYASDASARQSIRKAIRYIVDWAREDDSVKPFHYYIRGGSNE